MKNWYEIIPPHADVHKGHFDEAVFAADLGDVVVEAAPDGYRDPYLFYRKTYLTAGLENLLERIHMKLTKAVATLLHAMLVVIPPSSWLEDFGQQEEESLAHMEKGTSSTPV